MARKTLNILQPRGGGAHQVQFSVRVPSALLDELNQLKKEAAGVGLSLPLADLITTHLNTIIHNAKKELQGCSATTTLPGARGKGEHV